MVYCVCMQLGGLFFPDPNQCRMFRANSTAIDEPMDLLGSELYDYPSVGQIAQALTEQDIISIFATTQDFLNLYQVSKHSKHLVLRSFIYQH